MTNAQLVSVKDIIRDPVISQRCKILLKRRSKKIRVQQKLNAMILRNKKAHDELKPSQKVTRQKLQLNKTQLRNNLKLVKLRIKSMEENIVRQGCPGITL
jgi:hypothetical protein